VFERVTDPLAVAHGLDVVTRLGAMVDVDVEVRSKDVVEHPLQRLGEGGGGVLHARRLHAATTAPRLHSSPGRTGTNSAHDDERGDDRGDEPDREQKRRQRGLDAGELELKIVGSHRGAISERNERTDGSAERPAEGGRGQSEDGTCAGEQAEADQHGAR
jgi:hypothetical protein